jgi:gliding motility-associated-like protein
MLNDTNISVFWEHALTDIKPRTVCGEAGLLLYYTSTVGGTTSNYREAVSVKLSNELNENICYNVSFYIRFYGYFAKWYLNGLNYATNRVSALISPDSTIYITPGFIDLFQLNPQINYHGAAINDTTTWVKVEGSFIAQGNEQWMHVTSFVPDDSVTVFMLPSFYSQIDSADMPSYYLIDDVAVYPCDAPVYVANAGNDTCIKPGNSVTIGTAGHSEYLYWWYDEHGNLVDTSAQITVYPTQTTTYTLVQKDFKFDETRDTVTVTVDAHCYEVVIPDTKIPNVISPNGDGINDKFVIENSKYYNIKLIIFNRWGNQIFESNDYQNNWPASDVADGVYFYILTTTNPKQEVKEYKGSVSVVR